MIKDKEKLISYKLITLLEKNQYKYSMKNTLLFIYYHSIFYIKYKLILLSKSSNKIPKLLLDLFREYFYLQEVISAKQITNRNSLFVYIKSSSIIYATISYLIQDTQSYVKLQIEYNRDTHYITAHIERDPVYNGIMTTFYSNFNIDSRTLKNKDYKILTLSMIDLLLNDIYNLQLELFYYYKRKRGN